VKESAVSAAGFLGHFLTRVAAASVIMSVSQYVEIGLTHRPPSDLPVRLVETITRTQANSGRQQRVAGEIGQGTLAATALVSADLLRRIPTIPAVVLNALMMSLANAAIVRAVKLGGMPWTWSRGELAVDLTHKTVLSLATRAMVERQHISPSSA
jgi:hypothetical protein